MLISKKGKLFLFIAFCLVSINALSEFKKAQIEFSEPVYNFGTVREGFKVVHSFDFTNSGNADLVIQRVVPACGCTTSSIDNEKIKPGDSATISVELDTTGFSGNKTKRVRIYTNDFDSPISTVTLAGVILKDIETSPKSIVFGKFPKSKIKERGIKKLKIKTIKGVKFLKIDKIPNFVTVSKIKQTKSEVLFEVKIKNAINLGSFRDKIVILYEAEGKQYTKVVKISGNAT